VPPTIQPDDRGRGRAKRLHLCILVFVCSFLIRVGTAGLYVRQFDRYEDVESSAAASRIHAMVKSDAEAVYYRPATTIIEQVRSGRSLFFAGSGHIGSFLYPRILAVYGLTTGKITLSDDGGIPTRQVFGFLVAQSLLFAGALVYFFASLSGTINSNVALLSSLFLAFEPTLVQYNAMIMTESLFVALLLVLVSTWLIAVRSNHRDKTWFCLIAFGLVGALSGLLYLQRTVSALFAVVLIIGTYAWSLGSAKLFLIRCASMLAPLALMLALVGLHNQIRAGVFYIVPLQAAYAWGIYLANYVLAEVNHSSPDFERVALTRRAMMQIKAEGRVQAEADRIGEPVVGEGLDVHGEMLTRSENVLNEVEYYHLCRAVRAQAQRVFLAYPIATARLAIRNTIKSLNVDPLFTYRFYSSTAEGASDGVQRPREGALRIAYSLLILLPVAAGWLCWREALPFRMHLFLTVAMLYFPAIAGWMGWGRYILPNLVFYSVYWSVGVTALAPRIRMVQAVRGQS
jgi:hypothetical protein